MNKQPKRVRRWSSVDHFRAEISGRGVKAGEVIMISKKRARAALRDTILQVLADGRARTGREIRAAALALVKLKSSDAYHVCLNSWALVDLQASHLIAATHRVTVGPRGGKHVEKIYSVNA